MNDKKKISVIVPVYNTEDYLAECFDSIFNQTIGDIEVIAIDDGSMDGSLRLLQEIQDKYPSLIIKTQDNLGLGATRNIGIRETAGRYIYFMDSDDVIEPDMLEISYMLLEKTGADFVGFQADIFGEISGKNEKQYAFVDNYLDHLKEYNGIDFQKEYHWIMPLYNVPFCVYRRSFIEENNLYFMEGVLHEDSEFYWRMMTFDPRFIVSRDVMYHRRYRFGSIMTGINYGDRFKSKLKIYKTIAEETTTELKDVYLYYSISSISKTLRNAYDSGVKLEYDDFLVVADFLNMISEMLPRLSILSEIFLLDVIDVLKSYGYEFGKANAIRSVFKIAIRNDLLITKLYDENSMIALYGTGSFSYIVLDQIIKTAGCFTANVKYVDTYKKKGEGKFRGNDVYNYREVNLTSFDLIIVLSELFEEDIKTSLIEIGVSDKVVGMRQYIYSK